MAATDWNFRHPVELQDYAWDCAAASLAWCLQAIGRPMSEEDVIVGLGPTRISPTYGLHDASGAGLVEYLGEIGVNADTNPDADWNDLVDCAGYQPVLIGGRGWYHWSGVRMGGDCAVGYDAGIVALANPSPGWMNVGQSMNSGQWDVLGGWTVVWFLSW